MQRALPVVLLLALASAAGCTDQLCPDGWEQPNTYECTAPAGFVEEAEEALETGLYGYVVLCEDDDGEDDYTCGATGVQVGGTLSITRRIERTSLAREDAEIQVGEDSTFRAELPPGIYSFEGFARMTVIGDDDAPSTDVTLRAGDTFMLRVVIDERSRRAGTVD